MNNTIELLEGIRNDLYNQEHSDNNLYKINKLSVAIKALQSYEKKDDPKEQYDFNHESGVIYDKIDVVENTEVINGVSYDKKIRLIYTDLKQLYEEIFNKKMRKGFIKDFCEKYDLSTGNGSCDKYDKANKKIIKQTGRYIDGIRIKGDK